jgi:hypothetical protein
MKLFTETNSNTATQHIFKQLISLLTQSLGSGIFLCSYLMAHVYHIHSAHIHGLRQWIQHCTEAFPNDLLQRVMSSARSNARMQPRQWQWSQENTSFLNAIEWWLYLYISQQISSFLSLVTSLQKPSGISASCVLLVLNFHILLSDSWLPSSLLYVLCYAHWTLWSGYPS